MGASKIGLTLTNFIFLAIAVALLSFGAFVRFGKEKSHADAILDYHDVETIKVVINSIKTQYSIDVKKYLGYFSTATLVASLVIGVFAIIGFSAIFCDSLCLMKLYIFIAILLFVGLMTTAFGIFYYNGILKDMNLNSDIVKKFTFDAISSYDDANKTHVAYLNMIFLNLDCCGFTNASDFNLTTKWNRTLANGDQMITPLGCCKLTTEEKINARTKPLISILKSYNCSIHPTEDNNNFDKGCFSKITEKFYQNVVSYLYIGVLLLSVVVFFGITSAFAVCCIYQTNEQIEPIVVAASQLMVSRQTNTEFTTTDTKDTETKRVK